MGFEFASLTLGLVCLAIAYAGKSASGSWLSPLGVFSGTWAAGYLLFGIGVVDFITIRTETWLILAGATVLFSLGAYIPLIGLARACPLTDFELRPSFARAIERVTIISFPLAIVGVVAYLRIVDQAVGVEAYANELSAVRSLQGTEEFKAGFSGYRFLYYLNIVNAMSAVLYLRCYRTATSFWRKAFWMIGIASFAASLFSADRTLPFSVVMMAFFVVEYSRPVTAASGRNEVYRLFIVTTGLTGLFLGIGAMVGKTSENHGALRQVSHFPEELEFLASPYVYLTGNLPAFQEYMSANSEWATGGLFTVLPISKILRGAVDQRLQLPVEVAEFVDIPFPFNAQTYLNVYWSDFGLLGVLLVPLVLGFSISSLYRRMRLSPSGPSVCFSAISSYAVSHTIFVNKFVSTPVWQHTLFIGFVYVISKLLSNQTTATKPRRTSQVAL